ncbi:MAG: CoxG family protein [Gammaproteobacteria bacterium]
MPIKFEGEFDVTATPEEAYAVLSDTTKYAPLLPTYVSHEVKDDGSADVTVKVGVGKIRGKAVINLTRVTAEEPTRAGYTGKGKVMGGAFNMDTVFELEPMAAGGTLVKWEGSLNMFGKLVALAGGLIRPIAKKDIERLIAAIKAALSPDASAAAG